MDKIIKKLGSRKLWVAVLGVVSGIIMIIDGASSQGAATIITSVVGYLVAEGLVDAKAVKSTIDVAKEIEKIIDSKEDKTSEEEVKEEDK